MKKNNKGYRVNGFVGLVVAAILVVLLLSSLGIIPAVQGCENPITLSSVNAAAADDEAPNVDEEYASTNTETFRYLTVPLKGLSVHCNEVETPSIAPLLPFLDFMNGNKRKFLTAIGANYFAREVRPINVILRFNNVLSKQGNPLLVIAATTAECPSYFWNGTEFIFQEDLTVNIRTKYYDIMKEQEGKLDNIYITLYAKGYGLAASTKAGLFTKADEFKISGMTLFSTATEIDPEDPGDNGGEDVSQSKAFLDWFLALPLWFQCVLIVCGVVLVLFLLGFILKLFKS